MYCRLNNEFEWLMEMIKKGNCFFDWEDVAEFIDDDLLQLRYMKKRFGYLFYDEHKYIKKINGRNAIFLIKSINMFVENLKNQNIMELMKMEKLLILPFLWKTQSLMRLSF